MDINNFRVSPDGESLELWIEVPNGPNYTDIEIDKIAIQDHKHYTVGYPTSPQVELIISHPIESLRINNTKKVIRILKFKSDLLALTNTGLFYLYVKQKGVPHPNTPCCCNKEVTQAVAVNLYPIYNNAIKCMSTLINDCSSPDELIDIYLKKQMFLQAVELEDYTQANIIFDMLLAMEIQSGDCLNACSNNITISHSSGTTGGCNTCR